MIHNNRSINDQLNVLNKPILSYNCNKILNKKIKLTGIYIDDFCKKEKNDFGYHTVCSIMIYEFLEFSKSVGNNLSDPVLEYNFLGVSTGDRWCLCAKRWKQSYFVNKAFKLILESTNILTLSVKEFRLIKNFYLENTGVNLCISTKL